MARGTWNDFIDKYGFSDGEGLESRDFLARDNLCRLLNATDNFQQENVRAIAFDRNGMHNACLILLLPTVGDTSDTALLEKVLSGAIDQVSLPDIEEEMFELIEQAYEEIIGSH